MGSVNLSGVGPVTMTNILVMWQVNSPGAQGCQANCDKYNVPSKCWGNSTTNITASTNLDIIAHKFNDLNGDGDQDSGEVNLSGWTMELYNGSGCSGSLLLSNVTDVNGDVVFEDLAPGEYWIHEQLQPGWQATTSTCQNVTRSNNTTETPTVNFGNKEAADLSINKSDDPDPVSVGGLLTYTLTVTNNGPGYATGVVVNDTLPDCLTNADYSTDGGSSWNPYVSGSDISLGGIPNGNSKTVLIRGDADCEDACTIVNTANVSSDTNDPDPGNNTASEETNMSYNADFSIEKSADVDTATVGDVINYTYTVNNTGDVTLTNVTVTDSLLGAVTLNKTSLAPNELATGMLNYTVTETDLCANITNNATANATDPCGNVLSKVSEEVSVSTSYNANFSIEKTADKTSVSVGDVINYTVTVNNTGNASLSNVTVIDTLITLTGPTGDTDSDNELDPNETWTYTGSHTVTQDEINTCLPVNNTVTANATDPCGGTITDTDSCTINVEIAPGIEIVKTVFNESSGNWEKMVNVSLNDTVKFKLWIHNNGSCCNLTGINVTDIMSNSLKYVGNCTTHEPDNVSDDNRTVIWNLTEEIAPCENITIEFDANVTICGETDTNDVNVTAYCAASGASVYDNDTVSIYGECPGQLCISGYKLNETGAGLAGWTVNVSNATTESLVSSNVTNEAGYWIVCGLPDGNYTVCEKLQPDWTALDPSSGCYLNVTIAEDVNVTNINFTNRKCNGSIGDFVWYDTNEDGIQDANESGIRGGVIVKLYQHDDIVQLITTTITNESGFYRFSNVCEGNYSLEFVLPFGYVFSPQNQDDDDLDSDADPQTGWTDVFHLGSGENNQTLDAGIYYQSPVPVPALTPIGLFALIGILSAVLAVATMKRRG
jgi:uncharacterized repeat protein (TIGR01451 family)